MSILVRLPEHSYRADAFKNFTVDSEFTLGNAQAMMWLSQLAYETDDGDKIERILRQRFGLKLLDFGINEVLSGFLKHKACFIVARGQGATFIAFAGTDPLKPQDVITDITADQTTESLHRGFADAVASVQSGIEEKIGDNGQPLFFTGHSLGGALATISAMRARNDKFQVKAVYTYGGARAGGQQFCDNYGLGLRNCTFRLVHGNDIVPSVPPSSVGGFGIALLEFHHVGRLVLCPRGSAFAGPAPAENDGNEPDDFLAAGIKAVFNIFRQIPNLELRPLDPLTLDTNNDLPEQIRDHVPASYFRALKMPLAPPP